MLVGVPKEIKSQENRVALTPGGAGVLRQAGYQVVVQAGAGAGSGFDDEAYRAAGAILVEGPEEVFARADMIMKVKEPLPPEYNLFKPGQILFTYLHLAPEPELTRVLLEKEVVGVAYETIESPDGSLPLLTPMSEIAGRMAVQIGAQFLEKPKGGRGVLLGGVPGVPPARVTIIGGGIVGTNAAKMAVGMGATVTVIDKSLPRLRYLDDIFAGRLHTLASNSYSIQESVAEADLVIGAVLVHGAKAPRLVTEEMVRGMKPGAVIVDVAIDQGGCVETIDRVTTHADPIYVKHGVVHYAVANMPGAVPRTSTLALTNATLPYAMELAGKGWLKAIKENAALAKGVNVLGGKLTYQAVAASLGLAYTPLEEALAGR
ncbi:alanine dehydrogenase [Clostridiales bacterium PH28_bin88]|nr:alanine dehydrogenase [Clostridiales bacterium PH28_bin88]